MEHAVSDSPIAPAVPQLPLPRLVADIELIGPYQGSGYEQPKYLVGRPDGQVIQLPHLLYQLVSAIDGQRDLEQLATRLGEEIDRGVTAAQVSFLIERKLRPSGIVAVEDAGEPGGEPAAPARRPDALLALRYRAGVVPPRVAWRIAGFFRPMFWPPVVIAALAAFGAADAWILLRGGLGQVVPSAQALVQRPALTLLVLGLVFVSGVFHECGHVTACRYGGARPGVMGVGIYLVWPALYSTVTDAYRLSRVERLRTDLGGIYFNLVFIAGMSLAYLDTGAPWLLVGLVLMHVETAWQFLPSIRLDGYYILADLVGIPDLFSYIGPVLIGLIPGCATRPQVRELRPWARRVITLWVVLAVPTLLFWLAAFLTAAPRVIPAVWSSLLGVGSAVAVAAGQAQPATVALGVLQIVLLLLPWVGIALITVGFARTFVRAIRAVRAWLRAPADARVPSRRRVTDRPAPNLPTG